MPAKSPDEITIGAIQLIPEDVYEVVNDLLARGGSFRNITIYQKDVISALTVLGYDRAVIFQNNYLDFEPAYRAVGWKVRYDQPAYYENYEPYWIFCSAEKD